MAKPTPAAFRRVGDQPVETTPPFAQTVRGRLILCVISIILLSLAFAPLKQFYCAWFGLTPWLVVVARAGWQWTAVEGTARLIGPDDPHPDVDDERLRLLLREIFTAAGGTHDDWDGYDATMRAERRTAVIVTPTRVYSNPT